MDAAVMFKTANLLLQFLGSPICKEIQSIWKYEKELKTITDTISLVGRVLSDIESKNFQEESVISGYKRLQQAFLDAEDFLDKVETHKNKSETDDRKSKKIRRFFSSSNQPKYAVKVHKEIKEHRKNFDSIAQDLQKFGLSERDMSESTSKRVYETYSFVDPVSVIGRDEDKRNILDLLYGSSSVNQLVSIVGIGGMGKTTLAQLVFNDERLFDLKLWVSDSQKFDMKLLLMKILLCISPDNTSLHNLGQEQLQNRLVREIRGKKYLLVLDDVRNESRKNWLKLEDLLNSGSRDSRILVTTRSRKVAEVMGSGSTYELKGLSLADSWKLFERMAFERREDEKLIEIGKLIVQKCCQVPLAIKTMGCLLFREDVRKWEQVRDFDLAKIEEENNDLIPILKISYDDLGYSLKQCFRYCALFPKNTSISREMVSSIWMANGCIETQEAQSGEDICDYNLKILYNRCFLEEAKRDKCGEVTHFKMHDLMHDLAKKVAGREMLVMDSGVLVDSSRLILPENVRHMNLKCIVEIVDRISTLEAKNSRLRTLLYHDVFTWRNPWEKLISVERLISSYQVVRVLDLQKWRMESLPDSIGKLIHLRYLNLSYNEFKTLPDSIAELWNLQSLLLKSCTKLEELPIGTVKLVNLRHLDLEGCHAMTRMPSGMGALTYLQTLYNFIVGPPESKSVARLEDLDPLSKLQGELVIKLPHEIALKDPVGNGAFLLNKKLKRLKIEWPESRSSKSIQNDMYILAKLQPHSDLEDFTLYGYEGLMFPPWAPNDDLTCVLPNLVSITIENSSTCTYLPSFSRLVFLKRLTICNLSSLEYIEDNIPSGTPFFPALDYLWLMGLEGLKGWCRSLATEANDSEQEQSSMLPPFPCLSDLHIYGCPNLRMIYMPLLPIKDFCLKSEGDDAFTLTVAKDDPYRSNDFYATSSSFVSLSCKLHTNDGNLLLSLPWEKNLQGYLDGKPLCLVMKDFDGFNIESTNTNEALKRMSNRLVSLKFHSIQTLRTLSEGMRQLSLLRELHIERCDSFTLKDSSTSSNYKKFENGIHDHNHFLRCDNDDAFLDSEMPWKGLKSVAELKLINIRYMRRLPSGISFVTSLQVLDCSYCERLKELPKEIRNLINLRELNLEGCYSLTHMPAGIGALTSLCKLSRFVVRDSDQFAARLEELEPLLNLQGDLVIFHINHSEGSRAVLRNKGMLRSLTIEGPVYSLTEPNHERHTWSFAQLQPHCNLKELSLYGYEGTQFPSWMPKDDLASVLPNLERLTISYCRTRHHFPSLSRLPCLTHLEIRGLSSLEYIEDSTSAHVYFPSLQCVRLSYLPKLKGWSKELEHPLLSPSLPSPLELHIHDCPLLTMKSMPITSIRRFHFQKNPSHNFTVWVKEYWWSSEASPGSCYEFSTNNDHFLISTPWENYLKGDSASLCINGLDSLAISHPTMSTVLQGMSNCLTSLKILNSRKFRTLPKEIEHLSNLRELHIESCHDFTFSDGEEPHLATALASLEIGELSSLEIFCQGDEIQWKDQLKCLESLTLKYLPKMVRLPNWIQLVRSFRKLEICDCNNLVIPRWVRETFLHEKLTSTDEEIELFRKM